MPDRKRPNIHLASLSFGAIAKANNNLISTFMVLRIESPSTEAIQEHLASLPSRDEANLTIIQIKRQERSYYRQLKVWKMRFTSCLPALDMLTLPLVSLSKPVGPFNELGTPWRTANELNPDRTQ